MSLWKIAWRSIQQRALASAMTAVSMALGVMLVVAVLIASVIVERSFESGNNLGYNLIVGAKGGRLDLLLNTVFYLNRPIENIPWSYYQEFLPASKRHDGKDGTFVDRVELAIPECLGDYVENTEFRVVGTIPDMFTELPRYREYREKEESPLPACPPQFEEGGRCFRQDEFTSAVLGAEVASKLHKKVGDEFQPSHGIGPSAEKHMPFKIVGILKRTGTPNDRAAFINLEGFFLIPDHAKGHIEEPKKPGDPEDPVLTTPLPDDQREATSVLICTRRIPDTAPGFLVPALLKSINKDFVAQAIQPVLEITTLTNTFVRPLQIILLMLTVMIVIVAGVGIMVSIYTSMSERRHEIAVMRALGARRGTVMLIVLFESILLAFGGGLLGWLIGHLLIGAAGPMITDYTGVVAPFLLFAPYELILIPALIVLAALAGFLPALAAYRTDVGKALTATP